MLDSITPAPMLDRLAQLRAQSPEFETLHYILGPERILEWAHSVGVSTDHRLRDLSPPVPPHELRSIVAAPSESVFLWSGLKDAQMLATYIDRYVPARTARSIDVLDFGCGCGRTTRFLQHLPQVRVHGTDINEAFVAWCRNNLPDVQTSLNGTNAELAAGTGAYDFIYLHAPARAGHDGLGGGAGSGYGRRRHRAAENPWLSGHRHYLRQRAAPADVPDVGRRGQ